jgi:hypothetical protein
MFNKQSCNHPKPGAATLRASLFTMSSLFRFARIAFLVATVLSASASAFACRNDQAIIDRHQEALDADDE